MSWFVTGLETVDCNKTDKIVDDTEAMLAEENEANDSSSSSNTSIEEIEAGEEMEKIENTLEEFFWF